MSDWAAAWDEATKGVFDLCYCEHFAFKHDLETGHCYGVNVGSVRCECRAMDPQPEDDA